MPRVISFIVLLAIVLLVGSIFFQVMAQFIVPLFLASVLLVVFQPLHAWALRRLHGHRRLAALLTTILIMLAVLLPLAWLGWNAYRELYALSHHGEGEAPIVLEMESDVEQALGESGTGESRKTFTELLSDTAFLLRDGLRDMTGVWVSDKTIEENVEAIPSFIGGKVIRGVQSAFGILVGLAIMVISLYYFLADGPEMIRTAMYLSPLDSTYERELLERFGDVSRAVVVATLLSAVVQGALAGVGYLIALPSDAPIFLLTALTMVFALVPFVGAAAVWVCVCGWIYFYGEHIVDGQVVQGDPLTAIVLAVYCTIVVSGIDNVIKPYILHGQSRLHPLLALLSILGGVQVLGPVGIIVGPMLVSFLQALLYMLRRELDAFGDLEGKQLAAVVEGVAPIESEPNAAEIPAAQSSKATSADDDRHAKTEKIASQPTKTTKATEPGRSKRKRRR